MSDNDTTQLDTNPTLTGYKCAKMINETLTDKGLKALPAQMIYQYIGKKMIPSTEVVVDGKTKKLVSEYDLAEWLTKYLTRKAEKAREAAKVAITVTTENK